MGVNQRNLRLARKPERKIKRDQITADRSHLGFHLTGDAKHRNQSIEELENTAHIREGGWIRATAWARTINDWSNVDAGQPLGQALDGHLGAAPLGGVTLAQQVDHAHFHAVCNSSSASSPFSR